MADPISTLPISAKTPNQLVENSATPQWLIGAAADRFVRINPATAFGAVTPSFATRAAFVTWTATTTPPVGAAVWAGGFGYVYNGTATIIADLPGYEPAVQSTVAHFGAVGDGTTDDTAKVQNGLNSFGVTGEGGILYVPNGFKLRIASTITIPKNVILKSDHTKRGDITPALLVNYTPAIYLASTAKIILGKDSAGIAGLVIFREGLQWNINSTQVAAQFQGTAIEIAAGTTDCTVGFCTILGFLYAIQNASGGTVSRVHIFNNHIDCVNGVSLQNSTDVSVIENNHCWPHVTLYAGFEPEGANLKRTGTGFKLTGPHDWTRMLNNFTYGYYRGFEFVNTENVLVIGCGADYVPMNAGDGSIGFYVSSATNETRFIGCQAAASEYGFFSATTSTTAGRTTMTDCGVWQVHNACVVNGQGTLLVTGGTFRRSTRGVHGILTWPNATETRIVNCAINGAFTNGIANDQTTRPRLFWDNVDFTGCVNQVVNPYIATIAAANPLVLDGESSFYQVTGTANFDTINQAASYAGKFITLEFLADPTVATTGNILLTHNFNARAGDTLTLRSNGTQWQEISRTSGIIDRDLSDAVWVGDIEGSGVRLRRAGTPGVYGNYLDLYSHDSGTGPGIQAQGVDANVSLFLTTKGTGEIVANNDVRPLDDSATDLGTATRHWRNTYTDRVMMNGLQILTGTGTPEGVVTAPVGSLFLRSDGGVGTSFYVKQSGAGNTGWAAK